MRRVIVGFEADDAGDWVARLDCHHRQHIRHRPPIWSAPWIEDDVARARHVGAALACPLCDRCELPSDLTVLRTTPTWDERTMPDALRAAHRVSSGRWGRLRVLDGSLRFVAETDPVTDAVVGCPPGAGHPARRHPSRRAGRADPLRHRLPRSPELTAPRARRDRPAGGRVPAPSRLTLRTWRGSLRSAVVRSAVPAIRSRRPSSTPRWSGSPGGDVRACCSCRRPPATTPVTSP